MTVNRIQARTSWILMEKKMLKKSKKKHETNSILPGSSWALPPLSCCALSPQQLPPSPGQKPFLSRKLIRCSKWRKKCINWPFNWVDKLKRQQWGCIMMCSKHSKPFAGSSQHLHGSALLVSVGFCFSASRSVAAIAAVAKARTLQVIHGPRQLGAGISLAACWYFT